MWRSPLLFSLRKRMLRPIRYSAWKWMICYLDQPAKLPDPIAFCAHSICHFLSWRAKNTRQERTPTEIEARSPWYTILDEKLSSAQTSQTPWNAQKNTWYMPLGTARPAFDGLTMGCEHVKLGSNMNIPMPATKHGLTSGFRTRSYTSEQLIFPLRKTLHFFNSSA